MTTREEVDNAVEVLLCTYWELHAHRVLRETREDRLVRLFEVSTHAVELVDEA
jgi:hypothetical protein